MASREKKLSTGRKQASASPVPPKEAVAAPDTPSKQGGKTESPQFDDAAPKLTPIKPTTPKTTNARSAAARGTTVLAKKITKNVAKKTMNKTLGLNLKAKAKRPAKIKQQIAKALLNSAKNNLEGKKGLLRNGVKPKRIRRKKAQIEANEEDDSPPVLEPILPLEQVIEKKPPVKKRVKKVPVPVDENAKKLKTESTLSSIDDTINSILSQIMAEEQQKITKKPRVRKPKIEPSTDTISETIEDVMKDLSYLIKNEEMKSEVKQEGGAVLESGKTEVLKSKKAGTRKPRVDLLKKKAIKKENIENNLDKNITLDASAKHLIDMLDLSVRKTKLSSPICNRRHSIEKFPVDVLENTDSLNAAVFSSLPRTVTPKAKRVSKVRQSIDARLSLKRYSPYSTRSDSPAQILRNGKHRKMKDTSLFEGLDTVIKRRKRLCSDFSGSEKSVSKLSGYESDSSFSDKASCYGADNIDQKDGPFKSEFIKKEVETSNQTQTQDNVNIKSVNNKFASVVKRSLSTETSSNGISEEVKNEQSNFMDSNSNLCNDIKSEVSTENFDGLQVEPNDNQYSESIGGNPSSKVPEKSIILDIMKQAFNDINQDDQERRTTRSSSKKTTKSDEEKLKNIAVSTSKFYGVPDQSVNDSEQNIVPDKEEVKTEDTKVEDTKMEDKKTEDTKTEDTKMEDTKTEDTKTEDTKTEDTKMEDTTTEDTKTEGTKMEDSKMEDTKTEDTKMEDTKIEDTKTDCENIEEILSAANDEPPKLEQMELENNLETSANSDLTQSKEDIYQIIPELTEVDTNISEQKAEGKSDIEETPENLAIKENILQALGLQSLKAAEQAKLKGKTVKNDYTGTLKTVIKLNRCDKKKGRNTLKLTLQKTKPKVVVKEGDVELVGVDDEHGQKNSKESASTSWRTHTAQSSDTAGALRKSHYSNRSNNMDGSSEHTSDGDTAPAEGDDAGKILVIPEKASSFSIHPGRLCKDECSYCFGKFGLFDTPCHIAQMKSIERQDKILETERHLTRDSCLCDACYRHVDRKSNTPSYLNKGSKRSNIVAPGPRQNHCHVLGCNNVATNILRRKWLIKMRKSVCQVINIDLDNPGLHSIPICDEHYLALEHLMICAMCKRRLARNHIHYLGPEVSDLNTALNAEGIPVKLIDKPVVCKLCRYFASLVLKPIEERPENTSDFFKEYKKRLLHFHDVEVMDDAAAEEPIPVPTKEKSEKEAIKKKKKLHKSLNSGPPVLEPQVDLDKHDQSRVPSDSNSTSKSRSESPSDYMVDYHTLIPSIAMECGSDAESSKREAPKISPSLKKPSRPESIIKEAVEISKTMKLKNNCDNMSKNSAIAVQRLGSNPCISVRQLFPGEEELGLQGSIDFGNVKEKTPEGWEKCISTIQYDTDTKLMWHELQKPYGNQSSFLRHLILLEKYFRSGDLVLSQNASHHSINYSESVQNRIHAYDNIPMNPYVSSQIQFSVKKSNSGIITTKDTGPSLSIINAANIPKNTPITFSQINNLAPTVVNKTRNPGVPPGLISLHPGTARPTAPALIKVPQPQKIKIPLTKNWRPNLIPIDPNKKTDKRPGYVKVISGGKPYHITVDDYNRMCAIKKSYDLKQKRLMEAQAVNSIPAVSITQSSSILKSIMPRKGLTISKTATITSPKSDHSLSDGIETESSLEKLDRTVENLESKLAESTSMMNLPKIPKSLTVIPQTVTHKPSRPSSPALMITPKPKPSTSKS